MKERKKTLIATGSKPVNVFCNEGFYPANSSVWDTQYPAVGFCYDIASKNSLAGSSLSEKSNKLPLLYPEEEKDRRLKRCERYLARLKGNPEMKPISGREVSGQR